MTVNVNDKVRAILSEVRHAVDCLLKDGTCHTIFISGMGLTLEEKNDIVTVLGQGEIVIKMESCREPAEWRECGVSGVWHGVYYNHHREPIVETLEIGYIPQAAAAQKDDIIRSLELFQII